MIRLDDPPPRGVDRIPAPPVRADDSIFITISSYRDPNCAPTLARAFSRAARPEKVRVAVVHTYGTRRAADGWHSEYSEALEEMGFIRGQSSACVFWHPERQLITSVHGDDFSTA